MAATLDSQLSKIEIAVFEDRSDTMLYLIHSEGLENCHFHVVVFSFFYFSNYSPLPFWTVRSHKFKGLHLVEFE